MSDTNNSQIRLRSLDYQNPDLQKLISDYSAELSLIDPELGGFDASSATQSSSDTDATQFKLPVGTFIGAFVGSSLVGCGGVRVIERSNGAGAAARQETGLILTGEIKRMYLAPVARGKGVGRRLLSTLEDIATALGCQTVRLDTRSSLTTARALYQSAGYREIPRYNDNPFAQNFYERALPRVDLADGDVEVQRRLQHLAIEMQVPLEELPALPLPTRTQLLEGASNFRDIGGYETAGGGAVKRGELFRCDHLNSLTDRDRSTLTALEISQVFDFRLDSERERQPSATSGSWDPAITELSTADASIDGSMIQIVRDALEGKRAFPPPSFWDDNYIQILDAGRPMFVRLLTALGSSADNALFHCTGGKDRTGIAAALIHRLLGVKDSDIINDFLATNLYRTSLRSVDLQPQFKRIGAEVSDALPIVGVTRAAIQTALDEIDHTYGGAEKYLIDGGTPERCIRNLQARMIS